MIQFSFSFHKKGQLSHPPNTFLPVCIQSYVLSLSLNNKIKNKKTLSDIFLGMNIAFFECTLYLGGEHANKVLLHSCVADSKWHIMQMMKFIV